MVKPGDWCGTGAGMHELKPGGTCVLTAVFYDGSPVRVVLNFGRSTTGNDSTTWSDVIDPMQTP